MSRWTDWLRVTEIGQAAARRTGDRLSQARLHNDAGVVHYFLGREDLGVVLSGLNSHAEAIEYGQRYVGLLRETGSKRMLGHGLNPLGSPLAVTLR